MKQLRNNYPTLLLLVLIFIAPGLAAYCFFQHPNWLGGSKVNRGTLLSPAIHLDSLKKMPVSKWQIILWNPGLCDLGCQEKLDLLGRVRLALGRKLYQVDQQLLLTESSETLSKSLKKQLKENDFHLSHLSEENRKQNPRLFEQPMIFLADPNNYLILSYPVSTKPNDIYKDLKVVLNTSETKAGALNAK